MDTCSIYTHVEHSHAIDISICACLYMCALMQALVQGH